MWRLLVLLVVAVGVTTAYVSPDDHGRNTHDHRATSQNEANPRSKPKSLAAHHAEQGAALRAQEARRRGTRDVGSGSYASSGAGSGGYYQGNAYGTPDFGYSGANGGGNPFPFYPFHNPAPAFGPADVAAFFQYLQQMQQNFQQNAENNGLTNSYGFATRHGVFGPSGYMTSSSNSFNGAAGDSYGGQGGGVHGGSYGNGASAVASIGPQGGYGSAQLTPDLGNRFGGQSGEVPPPRGGTVGVFTSSSSGSSNINGQQTSYKEATSSINDNGKITTFTVRDPPRNQ